MEQVVKQVAQKFNNQQENIHKADAVEIVYYTDPLCCWSWAFEPQWRRLQYEFEGKLKVRYCMSGLLPSWKNYNDTVNSVSRPGQMGPVWMEAARLSGMPINNTVWIKNPPVSSYPACIAVKCAQLQSDVIGERYLRQVREAIMLHGQNIADQNILVQLAETVKQNYFPAFDLEQFKADLVSNAGLEAFKKDLNEIQSLNINRYPTLLFRQVNKPSIIMIGYKPYPVLLNALKQIAPDVELTRTDKNAEHYQSFWGSITQREIDELTAIV